MSGDYCSFIWNKVRKYKMEGKSCCGGLFWLFVGGLPNQKVISLCYKLLEIFRTHLGDELKVWWWELGVVSWENGGLRNREN